MDVHEIIDELVIRADPSGAIFRRIDSARWVEALEAKLPRRFPVSFRSLLTRYAFTPFDAGGLSFFANMGNDSPDELSVAIFNDPIIAGATLEASFIQFARPVGGNYDPVCFDARRTASNREFPIVRLNHEEVLCYGRIRVSERVADSFYRFAAGFVGRI